MMRVLPLATLPSRAVRFLARNGTTLLRNGALALPMFRFAKDTRGTSQYRSLSTWFLQKVIGFNRGAYWPMHFSSKVVNPKSVLVGVDSNPGSMHGCYIQAIGTIIIGDYCYFSCNVGIVSANHKATDLESHDHSEVRIGSYCLISMNSVVLPGVVLGDFTIVGAGSIVTRSFPEGYCVIAGNPARKIRDLDPADCVRHKAKNEYIGYYRKAIFEKMVRPRLWVKI